MTGTDNGRVSLRDLIEQRFDALDQRLDTYCKVNEKEHDDHETRIRTLEKREPWRNAVEVVLGVLAAIAAALGFTNAP